MNKISCFIGDTKFIEFDVINKFFYRRYSGRLIELHLKDGGVIKLTPNHPMYTQRGWVAAKRIKEEDSLAFVDRPYKDRSFYQMFNSFQKFEDLHPFWERTGRVQDFHGDGNNNIIYTTELYHSKAGIRTSPAVKELKTRLCEIEKVAFIGFSGYVFNIETNCGYYGVQTGGKTFIAKNCG